MTENEAIKEFQQNIDMPFGSNISREASELAIWVLEKQIPMKPILKNGETGSFVDYENGHGEYRVTKWQDWVCPICGWFVGQRYNRSQNHSHDQRKCNYCNECGQKIDWSDEE
jgi:hypothetical protein